MARIKSAPREPIYGTPDNKPLPGPKVHEDPTGIFASAHAPSPAHNNGASPKTTAKPSLIVTLKMSNTPINPSLLTPPASLEKMGGAPNHISPMHPASPKATVDTSEAAAILRIDSTSRMSSRTPSDASPTASRGANKENLEAMFKAGHFANPKMAPAATMISTRGTQQYVPRERASAPAASEFPLFSHKRTARQAGLGDLEKSYVDVDASVADIDIAFPDTKNKKAARPTRKPISKKRKVAPANETKNAVHVAHSPASVKHTDEGNAGDDDIKASPHSSAQEDVEMSATEDSEDNGARQSAPVAGDEQDAANDTLVRSGLVLLTIEMKRKDRILHPDTNPVDAALIAKAKVNGPEIYDDNGPLAAGEVGRNIGRPDLFDNVKFHDDLYDDDKEPFVESYHTYTPFVPGRFERMADGTARDQKSKLVVRIWDSKLNKRRTFRNPPPKDWNNQEAITSLNKRIAQQYRRNSNIRFREVMTPYCQAERDWILKQLGKDGKPRKGWKIFVNEFNDEWAGKTVEGIAEPRQVRSHSSLTKEVERFGTEYKAGQVPVPIADKDKRKVGAKRKAAAVDSSTSEKAAPAKKAKSKPKRKSV